mmetsp:Transcript_94565/g.305319  ORF Transcript_94565/g.305319 Transcript_94565/m.305319 type:complete len:220 (+) Transcript_94565:209-868(+)
MLDAALATPAMESTTWMMLAVHTAAKFMKSGHCAIAAAMLFPAKVKDSMMPKTSETQASSPTWVSLLRLLQSLTAVLIASPARLRKSRVSPTSRPHWTLRTTRLCFSSEMPVMVLARCMRATGSSSVFASLSAMMLAFGRPLRKTSAAASAPSFTSAAWNMFCASVSCVTWGQEALMPVAACTSSARDATSSVIGSAQRSPMRTWSLHSCAAPSRNSAA